MPPRIALALTVLVAMIAGLSLVGPAAATPDYDWPGMKKCGTFKAEYKTYVYANKHLRCKSARRVMREWWLGKPANQKVHGTGPSQYTTLKKYPGWRCRSGSGGGTCRKRKAVAGYQN